MRKPSLTIDDLKKKDVVSKKRSLLKTLLAASAPASLEQLSRELKLTPAIVLHLAESLIRDGKSVSITRQGVQIVKDFLPGEHVVTIPKRGIQRIRFAATADNHLVSKYSRLDVINALFDYWAAQGIDTVYQMGNIIDGECRFNRYDLHVHGIDGQIDYLIENWPYRKGMTTQFITGDDHEGWYIQREGINVGEHIEDKARKAGRTDLQFLGHMEHNIRLQRPGGESHMRIIHGGGGTAYAISYTDQKYVESLQGGEKPQLVLVGHYHKYNYGYPREVHAVQVGCTEDQTPFMRKKRIQAMVGGAIVEIEQDETGIIRSCGVQWIPFYDRSFYAEGKLWKYRFKK